MVIAPSINRRLLFRCYRISDPLTTSRDWANENMSANHFLVRGIDIVSIEVDAFWTTFHRVEKYSVQGHCFQLSQTMLTVLQNSFSSKK
jgi:hypothetical protein